MLTRLLIILFLLATLVGLVPLAHASPPDPAWISGLYDDADYDNVIAAATSMVGPEEPAPIAAITPATIVLQLTYFDTSESQILPPINLANIRRIGITLTAQSAAALNRGTFTINSSVRPRNL